jgi:hypothetical protein
MNLESAITLENVSYAAIICACFITLEFVFIARFSLQNNLVHLHFLQMEEAGVGDGAAGGGEMQLDGEQLPALVPVVLVVDLANAEALARAEAILIFVSPDESYCKVAIPRPSPSRSYTYEWGVRCCLIADAEANNQRFYCCASKKCRDAKLFIRVTLGSASPFGIHLTNVHGVKSPSTKSNGAEETKKRKADDIRNTGGSLSTKDAARLTHPTYVVDPNRFEAQYFVKTFIGRTGRTRPLNACLAIALRSIEAQD